MSFKVSSFLQGFQNLVGIFLKFKFPASFFLFKVSSFLQGFFLFKVSSFLQVFQNGVGIFEEIIFFKKPIFDCKDSKKARAVKKSLKIFKIVPITSQNFYFYLSSVNAQHLEGKSFLLIATDLSPWQLIKRFGRKAGKWIKQMPKRFASK